MLFSIVKWSVWTWACLALAVMGHYARLWKDFHGNETRLGFMIGAFYSWPAWLALPCIVIAQRKSLPGWQKALLLAPLLMAVGLYAAVRFF